MKKSSKAFLFILSGIFCVSCAEKEPTTPPEEPVIPHEYVSLSEAIENTSTNYMFVSHYFNDASSYFYHEIYKENEVYSKCSNMFGYIVVPEDKDYVHLYESIADGDSSTLNVRGRNMPKFYFEEAFKDQKFIDTLTYFEDDFNKVSDNVYGTSVSDFILYLSDFIESKNVKYCNYFELVIGEDDRLSELRGYEVYGREKEMTINLYFHEFSYEQWKPYQEWNKNGRVINTTILDLKSATYDHETIEIDGIVTSSSNTSITIANKDDFSGPIGISVECYNSFRYSVGDKVHVKGMVLTDRVTMYTYMEADEISIISSDNYLPTFNEEFVLDSYGAGTYNYYYFSLQPLFSDSLYLGFGYINSLPDYDEDSYLNVEIICPDFVDDRNNPIKSTLVIPNTVLDFASLYAELESYGEYSVDSSNAKLICFENVLVAQDVSVVNNEYVIDVKYQYLPTSKVYIRKAPEVRFKEVLDDENFTLPASNNTYGYPFGADSGVTLESIYNKSGNKEGYYIYLDSVKQEQFNSFINYLNANYTLIEGVKDTNLALHYIYRATNGKYIDVAYSEYFSFGVEDQGNYTVQLWCYDGDVVLPKLIKEKVAEKITSSFDIDSFQILPGTYDSNYEIYTLYQYAGQEFKNGLTIVTIDIPEATNRRDELCLMYLGSNYTTVRLDNGNPYSYVTRGSSHMVYKSKSNDHLFVDIASYSTNQYTFTGSESFSYRIEVLIYEADAPIDTVYESDLSTFNALVDEKTQSSDYSIKLELPTGTKVETVIGTFNYTNYDDLYYGYLDNNVFIYANNLQTIYNDLMNYFNKNGFDVRVTGRGKNFMASKYDASFNGTYYTIIYDTGSNNIRILNGLGTRF